MSPSNIELQKEFKCLLLLRKNALSLLPYPRDSLVLPRKLLRFRVGESARGAALLVLVVAIPAAAPAGHMRGLVVLAETRAAF